MSDQEHEQQPDDTSDEPEETIQDLDVPDEEGKDVTGGLGQKDLLGK